MPRGPKPVALELSTDERQTLEAWSRRPTSAQRLASRSRIVLAAADGRSNAAIAADLQLTLPTVRKWRRRFAAARLDGLVDEPRPGAPRSITDEAVEQAVTRTLETKPAHATHWSTRLLAKEIGLSQNAVVRIWHAFGLKPHLRDNFKLSADPLFVDKVRDVVGLYLNPPDRAIVLCMDEKSQVQALDRTRPVIPMQPGQPERGTHDYVRHGTTSLFSALNVATGAVIGQCYRRHRHEEFLKFLDHVDTTLVREKGVAIHVVMDNYGTHKHPAVRRWFTSHPEYHCHFTPTSASWINQVERFFSAITTQRIRRGSFQSVEELEQAIEGYLAEHNQTPKPFVWTKSAELILQRVKAACDRITPP
jgi:transposase